MTRRGGARSGGAGAGFGAGGGVEARDRAPSWEDLRIALAVARAGSLARAAEALGVDPGTVSRRVAAAEAALGAILFARSSTGVEPTDAGKALLRRAGEMEARVARLCEEVAADGPVAGAVRVFCAPWAAARIAAVGAPSLRATHPGIEMRLVAARPSCEPPPGEPALALWFDKPTRVGDFAIRLGSVPFALYAPAGAPPDCPPALAHRDEDGGGAAPFPCALGPSVAAAEHWAEIRRAEGARFALTATDPLVLREAARAGLGAALLPMCLGEGDPLLENRSPGGPSTARAMMLHASPDTVQIRRVQAVIDLIRRRFDALFGAPVAARGLASPRRQGGSTATLKGITRP